MNRVAMLPNGFLSHRLSSTLITTANQKQVVVHLETLVPHLLSCIPALTMAFRPCHSSFGSIKVITFCLRFFSWSKSHVGRDDSASIPVTAQSRVGPLQNIIGGIALKVQYNELHSGSFEQLYAVGIVTRDSRRPRTLLKTSTVPSESVESRFGKDFLEKRRITIAGHHVVVAN